jgi:hypothetical protein
MKNLVLITIVFLTIQAKSQDNYLKMLGDNVVWYERTHYAEDNSSTYYFLSTIEDTIINDKQYYNLYYEETQIGYIRENDSGQVYFRAYSAYLSGAFCGILDSSLINEDLLLLNLNVEIGDTLFTPFYGTDEYIISYVVVYDIQYINQGGQERKVVYFWDDFEFGGNFIEGVGSDFGLFRFWCTEGYGVENLLECYFNDDQMVYGPCVVGINSVFKINFSVFPNPAEDQINISIDQNHPIRTVRIYEVTGRIVMEKTWGQSPQPPFLRGSSISLDVRELVPGMYLLEVETEDGFREVKQIIIGNRKF